MQSVKQVKQNVADKTWEAKKVLHSPRQKLVRNFRNIQILSV